MKTKNYYKTLKTLAVAIFMGCSVLSTQAQIYVNAAATGVNNGSSWDDAYTDLQAALDVAAENAEIRVAAGTYKPSAASDDSTDDNRDKAFHFNVDLLLKGSYNPATNAQDFTNLSILSGDFNDDDVITGSGSTLSITNNTENAYHVLITANLTTEAGIEGFYITGGHADGANNIISYSGKTFVDSFAGGMYNDTSFLSIVNTVFSGNAASTGAGMLNTFSSPSIANTVFSRNVATTNGGGMYNSNSSQNMVNMVFTGNSASTGGGIRNNNSSSTIYNSVFYGNGSDIENSSTTSSITGETIFLSTMRKQVSLPWMQTPFIEVVNP